MARMARIEIDHVPYNVHRTRGGREVAIEMGGAWSELVVPARWQNRMNTAYGVPTDAGFVDVEHDGETLYLTSREPLTDDQVLEALEYIDANMAIGWELLLHDDRTT